MADDVDMYGDMSPIPVTPSRSTRSDPFSTSPSCRPRKKKNIQLPQQIPSAISYSRTPTSTARDPIYVTQDGPQASLTQTTDAAFDAASKALQAKHTVLSTISKALDQAIIIFKDTAHEHLAQQIAERIANTIQSFTSSNPSSRTTNAQKVGLEKSIHAPSYAAIVGKTPKVVLSSRFAGSQPRARINQRPRASDNVIDNRIFVRLPEGHISRNHHIHAVKAALTEKLGLSGRPLKGVQHVKSGLALLPADADQAAKILEKAPEITAVLGGTVEKAEKWFNYVLDYVPRLIKCIDGSTVEVTPEMALEDIKFEIGVSPKRVAWTKRSLLHPEQEGSMVVSFASPVRAFRLFSTSTIARNIKRTPKVTQCNRCWSFHDQRKCNRDLKCPQCASKDHKSCQGIPKCCNCKGPHTALDGNCPAKPIVRRGIIIYPTRTEMARFRAAGEMAWNIANPQTQPQIQNTNVTSSC